MTLLNIFRKTDPKHPVILLLANGWIFVWNMNTATLLGGNGRAHDVCLYDNTFIQADPSGVVQWSITGPLLFEGGFVFAIQEFEGDLFVASTFGSTSGLSPSEIYRQRIIGNEMVLCDLVAKRSACVTSFCVFENRLYDSTDSGDICDTLTNETIAHRDSGITTLCSHLGNLYDGGFSGIYDSIRGNKIVDRLDIFAMCSHEGKPYYSQQDGIFEAHSDSRVLNYDELTYRRRSKRVKSLA